MKAILKVESKILYQKKYNILPVGTTVEVVKNDRYDDMVLIRVDKFGKLFVKRSSIDIIES